MIVSPVVIQELTHLIFLANPTHYSLNNYHNIHRRRPLNSRQLPLKADHLLRFISFCGTVECPKRENQGRSDLSHMILILNRFFVPSLVRIIDSNKRQFVVAQCSLTFSFFRTSLSTFSLFIFSTIYLNITSSTLSVSGRLLAFGPTKYSTQYF